MSLGTSKDLTSRLEPGNRDPEALPRLRTKTEGRCSWNAFPGSSLGTSKTSKHLRFALPTADEYTHDFLRIGCTLYGTPIADLGKSQAVQGEYGFPDTLGRTCHRYTHHILFGFCC